MRHRAAATSVPMPLWAEETRIRDVHRAEEQCLDPQACLVGPVTMNVFPAISSHKSSGRLPYRWRTCQRWRKAQYDQSPEVRNCCAARHTWNTTSSYIRNHVRRLISEEGTIWTRARYVIIVLSCWSGRPAESANALAMTHIVVMGCPVRAQARTCRVEPRVRCAVSGGSA